MKFKWKCTKLYCFSWPKIDETFLFRWNSIETKCLQNIKSLLILQKALKFKQYFNRNFYTNTIHNTSCKSLMWSNIPCLQYLKIQLLILNCFWRTPHDTSREQSNVSVSRTGSNFINGNEKQIIMEGHYAPSLNI